MTDTKSPAAGPIPATKSPEYEKGYEDGLRDGHTAASQDAARLYGIVGHPINYGARMSYDVVRLIEVDGVMIGLPINQKGEVAFGIQGYSFFQQKAAAFKVARQFGIVHPKVLVNEGHGVSTLREKIE